MPVKQNGSAVPKMASVTAPKKQWGCCGNVNCHCGHFGKKIVFTLVGILLAYLIVFMGTLVRNNLQKFYYIGQADRMERTITIDAVGKVTAKPDIAQLSVGMDSIAPTVAEAQKKNTEVMNNLTAKVKALGVEDKDIQTTNYNIYPQYDYTDGGSKLKGYQVSQSITIKIRNLANAEKVLALAGEVGANNVGGLQFTIDDNDVYKAEARQQAMEKIALKAKEISKSLGVRFVNIVSYNEYENSGANYPVYDLMKGVGGGVEAAPAPAIQVGSTDVNLNVNVTFGIR